MSGINLDLLKESENPSGGCQAGIGSSAIFCDGYLCRIYKQVAQRARMLT